MITDTIRVPIADDQGMIRDAFAARVRIATDHGWIGRVWPPPGGLIWPV